MKRTKTLKSFFSPALTPVIPPTPNQPSVVEPQSEAEEEILVQPETIATRVSNVDAENVEPEGTGASNDPNAVLNDGDIVADPGLHIPIDQNIARAMGLIGATVLAKERSEHCSCHDNGWEELFDEVKSFCLKHNIIIPNMEDTVTVRGHSRGRGGQLVTYYHHFKNEIFNVVYDQIIVEFNNRFAERSTQLLRCIACLDPRNSFANFDKGKLLELAKIYDGDFSDYEIFTLGEQLGVFINEVRNDPKFANCHDIGDLAIKMVQGEMDKDFALVYRLIELALILPVATATVERIFSAMKVIKIELRNKIGNDWLNHRMTCYIEREIFARIKDEDILYHFQEMKSRLPRNSASGSGSLPTVDEDMIDGN